MSLFSGQELRVIDTETTGLFADGHRLLEVASVRLDDGRVGEAWSSFVQPSRPIPAEASAVHGITDDMVRDAPAPPAVAAALRAEVGARLLGNFLRL